MLERPLLKSDEEGNALRQRGWSALRNRLFHLYFMIRRPMTLGVRALVFDEASRSVFLVRHTYVPGWQLPGGGVERGESLLHALGRELAEEANIRPTAPPELVSFHFNRRASPRDHVALYLIRQFVQTAPKQPDREIAEAGFFRLDALPDATTAATRRRLAEVLDGAAASEEW